MPGLTGRLAPSGLAPPGSAGTSSYSYSPDPSLGVASLTGWLAGWLAMLQTRTNEPSQSKSNEQFACLACGHCRKLSVHALFLVVMRTFQSDPATALQTAANKVTVRRTIARTAVMKPTKIDPESRKSLSHTLIVDLRIFVLKRLFDKLQSRWHTVVIVTRFVGHSSSGPFALLLLLCRNYK